MGARPFFVAAVVGPVAPVAVASLPAITGTSYFLQLVHIFIVF